MPTYEILIDNKPHKVEITKTSEKIFIVKIDGKTASVELQAADKANMEKPFTITIDGKTYTIDLPKMERDKILQIKVEEASFKAEVKTLTAKPSLTTFAPTTPMTTARKSATQNNVAEGAVTAPMTGKIVSVKVRKGDAVKQGQALCIIEAMKMENEIAAPKTGTVNEVSVSEGSAVSEGDVLFMIG
jgi:glutaconyl-CoA decarboxylase